MILCLLTDLRTRVYPKGSLVIALVRVCLCVLKLRDPALVFAETSQGVNNVEKGDTPGILRENLNPGIITIVIIIIIHMDLQGLLYNRNIRMNIYVQEIRNYEIKKLQLYTKFVV